ncbi:hypothetical protein KIL84_007251 [Mauremys mutica]|uniref:Uncharacterized protein n=1 Tax=Mauremys mutica TaxID=74926 RepID=A0A9D3X2V0_9SAUR|nr:hypothetical protein KIL84_007251 [Mauremys mutica]
MRSFLKGWTKGGMIRAFWGDRDEAPQHPHCTALTFLSTPQFNELFHHTPHFPLLLQPPIFPLTAQTPPKCSNAASTPPPFLPLHPPVLRPSPYPLLLQVPSPRITPHTHKYTAPSPSPPSSTPLVNLEGQ